MANFLLGAMTVCIIANCIIASTKANCWQYRTWATGLSVALIIMTLIWFAATDYETQKQRRIETQQKLRELIK